MAIIWNMKVTIKTNHQNNIKYFLAPKYPTNHKSHSTEDQAVDNASCKMVATAILNLKVRTYSYYKTHVKSKFPINNKSHSTMYPGCIMFLGYPSFYLFVRNLSRNLMDNAWEKWPETQHADVSWQSSELIRFWSWAV